MPLNKDQQSYLVQQLRTHAQWTIGNAALAIPTAFTEVEVAQALDAAGFVILQRPVTDVALRPTEEMQENQVRLEAYSKAINDLLGSYIDRILKGQEDNPNAVINTFVIEVAAVRL